jgi:hypothetical protein
VQVVEHRHREAARQPDRHDHERERHGHLHAAPQERPHPLEDRDVQEHLEDLLHAQRFQAKRVSIQRLASTTGRKITR